MLAKSNALQSDGAHGPRAADDVRPREPFHPAGEHLAIALRGARAVFTTRRGGFSSGPYATLNLGRWTADDSAAVERNRASLQAELGVPFAYSRQVHGSRVSRVSAPHDQRADPVQADGQACAAAGVGLMVLTADCLPIAIAGDGAVAMLHAGWRGLAAGIVVEGVAALRELGASGALSAAIGPGAGPCCYEVGEEVHAAFAGRSRAVRRGQNIDLKAIAAADLERAGVSEVHDAGLCTICSPLFFSHRRDKGITGRQAGVAWLT
jgi:polyphenol oxidase